MLLANLEDSLQAYTPRTTGVDHRVAAAVLVPLFRKDGEDHLLFTRRTQSVRDHKGQICFPGGAVEAEDENSAATALREADEEIGLSPSAVTLLGTLDDVVTHTGFHITPWVGRIPHPYEFRPDPREVDAVLMVPLRDLIDPANVTWGMYSTRAEPAPPDPSNRIWFYRSGPHTIWGITGHILHNFLAVAVPAARVPVQ